MPDEIKLIINRPFYTQYAWAYDRLTDKPVIKNCNFIDNTLKELGYSKNISILDAGCGTGSYSIELAKKEYQITGVDISQGQITQAIKKAKENNSDINFFVKSIFDLPEDTRYDVILCRGVLNDFIENSTRQKVFEKFSNLIKNNGLLIFDVTDWENSKKIKSEKPIFKKEIQTDSGLLRFTSQTTLDEKNKKLLITETHELIINNKETVTKYDFVMRCWTKDELDNCLTNAGFEIIESYGAYDTKIKSNNSEKIIIITKPI